VRNCRTYAAHASPISAKRLRVIKIDMGYYEYTHQVLSRCGCTSTCVHFGSLLDENDSFRYKVITSKKLFTIQIKILQYERDFKPDSQLEKQISSYDFKYCQPNSSLTLNKL